MPPITVVSGETRVSRRDTMRPVRTPHSKNAKAVINSTNMRCWTTSGSLRLAKKPMSPMGHTSGSARTNTNPARHTNSSGQCFAHGNHPLRSASAASPIVTTSSPAQWWLYSDQAMSCAFRAFGAATACAGGAGPKDCCPRDSSSSRAGRASASCSGLCSRGRVGVMRCLISASGSRSSTRSIAGGSDVIEAAAISTATPTPISTATKRRTRPTAAGSAQKRRTAMKFANPRTSSVPNKMPLATAIAP